MGWEIQKSSGATEKPPVGNHLAVMVGVFDMGKQFQEPFKAGDKGYWAARAFFVWELVGEKMTGADRNHVIGIDLTLSTDERSKLRKWVEARTGKPMVPPFDPTTELGLGSFLSVIANKKGYPVVNGMAALPKGIPVPPPTYKPVAISLDEYRAGAKIPEWCPWLYGSPLEEWIKACQQLGGARPQPRKSNDPQSGEQPAAGAGSQYTQPAEGDKIPF